MISFLHYSTILTKPHWYSKKVQTEPYKVIYYSQESVDTPLTFYLPIKGKPVHSLTRDVLGKELSVELKQVKKALTTFGTPVTQVINELFRVMQPRLVPNEVCDSCSITFVNATDHTTPITCLSCQKTLLLNGTIYTNTKDYLNMGAVDIKSIVPFSLRNATKKKLYNSLKVLNQQISRATTLQTLKGLVSEVYDLSINPQSIILLYNLLEQLHDNPRPNKY